MARSLLGQGEAAGGRQFPIGGDSP